MLLKHKENELKNALSNLERVREDITFRLQESLEKQHERLITEKQQDI